MRKINLLGATGSIGQQTLAIIRDHPEEMQLVAVSAGRNITALQKIIREFQPELVAVQNTDDVASLKLAFPKVTILSGSEGLTAVAAFHKGDIVVNAVMGSVGLQPTLAAIAVGKDIALANKETLVTAGHLVMAAVSKHQVKLLPVDSEHSAIFQCLRGEEHKCIERIILTASGGSFRNCNRADLANVTVADALNHPNWSMGAKITIDSATMMNKGLEVIEAHWLFNLPYEQINVLIHQESIIHSMVEFQDASVIAQLGTPDMRVPIQFALSYPKRLQLKAAKRLNLAEIAALHFHQVDYKRYPALAMAFSAGKIGGTMPTVLNAANEVAVALFLEKKISFLMIEKLVQQAHDDHQVIVSPDLDTITTVDKETRRKVALFSIS